MSFQAKRNFRPRSKAAEDDEDEKASSVPQANQAAGPAAAKPVQTALPTAPKPSSKATLLSFDDDGEDAGPLSVPKKKGQDKAKPKLGRAQNLPELPAVAAARPHSTAGE